MLSTHDEPRLRDQTKLWLAAISADLRAAIRQEGDGLRASIDQRVAALESIVSRNDELFERLTQDVHALAAEEALAAATRTREEAEAAAKSEVSGVRARFEADLEAARVEFETIRTAMKTQLAETERDIIAMRHKRDEYAAQLDEAAGRINALEEANAQAVRVRQVADARLEEEIQRRTMVIKQLDAARQEIVVAKAEADSCRLEAHMAGERVSAVEHRLVELEAAAQVRPTPADGNSYAVVDRIKSGIADLASASTDEILSTLLEHLSQSFAVAAVFAVEAKGLRLWKNRSGVSAIAIPAQIPLESESPVARAFRHRITVNIDVPSAGDGGAAAAPRRPGHAIAVPVTAQGRVIAVAYAENPPDYSDDLVRALETVAEILVGCVNQRLNRNQLSAQPQPSTESERTEQRAGNSSTTIEPGQYAVSRQARRVKINSSTEVLVDGVASTPVDVSALGAQIISPAAMRPNRCVRIQLPNGGNRLNCEGRIVWAQLDSARADAPATYRAGVCFVGINLSAITTFVSQYAPAETLAVGQK